MNEPDQEGELGNCEIRVVLRPPEDPTYKGYLGATISYDPLPGEGWRRGNDLSDGPANQGTLDRIMDDIAAVMAGYRNSFEQDHTS